MQKKLIGSIALLLISLSAFAQESFLRGKITDAETGEELLGTTVVVKGTTNGTVSDFEGNYSLPLTAGTYTISFSFVSYATKEVSDVVIKEGEITLLNVQMASDEEQLEAVIVSAERMKDDETAMLSLKKKSINAVDGISSQAFKKVGDSNLSSAMKRVTGVTVQGGKYVYVRGLGDRYSKTTLNGMTIPGIDPDRNDVQIDLFPTSILENVVVYKTFSPNLSGDFTGGLINIETKAFPEKKYTSVSVGVAYNPDMNLRSGFLKQEEGSTDFLGFDNGDRALPLADPLMNIPAPGLGDPLATEATRKFNPVLGANRQTSPLNHSLSFAHGNQINKEKVTFGYNAVLNYRANFKHYTDAENSIQLKATNRDFYSMQTQSLATGVRSESETLWSALASGSMKFDKHQFSLNLLRIQNGSEVNLDRSIRGEESSFELANSVLGYFQKSLTNATLLGKHGFGNSKIEWSNAVTFSSSDAPDYRDTRIDVSGGEGDISYQASNAGSRRYFQELSEFNNNARVDYTLTFMEKNKFRAGLNSVYKSRQFDLYGFSTRFKGSEEGLVADYNAVLSEANLWSLGDNEDGIGIINNTNAFNSFSSRQHIFAAYVMSEMVLTPKLKTVYGVRLEQANMFYTGALQGSTEAADDLQTLDDVDFLPSVSLVYELTDKINLRASANRTLARPSFREKSNAFIPNPITDIQFLGNINLEAAKIWNYDLRWEYFPSPSEVFSASLFVKDFSNHIAINSLNVAKAETYPRNIASSQVYGVELEARKQLDFLEATKNFSVGVNVSLVESVVDRSASLVNIDPENPQTELDDKIENAKIGEAISLNREMIGQAPYIVNVSVDYVNEGLGLSSNLSYNVQGETFTVRGVGLVPDIYTKPFNSLNWNLIKNLGSSNNKSITLKVSNLLHPLSNLLGSDWNTDKELVYKSFNANDKTFARLNIGSTISLKYSVKF